MHKKSAFTLMEIIVVLVILGIMATIFLPKLSNNQEAARIGEAVQILSAMHGAQLRWFIDHATYTADCTDLDVTFTSANFNNPVCTGGVGGGNVTISRNGGPVYAITVDVNNVYTCAGVGCTAFLTRYLPH